MLLNLSHLTLLLTLFGSTIAAPLNGSDEVGINVDVDIHKRQDTPNGQKEEGDGIDIKIGINGATTMVRVDSDGTPSVPLWSSHGPSTGPNSRDVRQGGMPDCWLDAVMVAVVDLYPEFLRNRFLTADGGLYHDRASFILTKDNEKKIYEVTYLDAAQASKLPAQNSDGSGFWWPAVIENAVQMYFTEKGNADVFKSGGWVKDSLELLTGVPSDQWMFDKEGTWQHMEKAGDTPIVITTKPEGQTKNLISFHAYTVNGRQEVNGVRYVILRNPWHDTQRLKFDDIFDDISSIGHFKDLNAKPTNL